MRRRLPSLNALRALEAAVRHSSFTRAANELFVTHAAISRQIRVLEKTLGRKLFLRQGQGVVPTEAGHNLGQRLTPVFDEMYAATLAATAGDNQPLVVRVDQAFATNWLVPRLSTFREQYPNIELVLDAAYEKFEPKTTEAEIAIQYSDDGEFKGLDSTLLSEVQAFAVCSAEFLTKHPIQKPDDLLTLALLHEESRSWWAEWMQGVAADVPAPAKGYLFDETHLALLAAEGGQGVALADDITAHNALAAGRLVRALPHSIPGGGYYLISRHAKTLSDAAIDLRDWILEELEQQKDERRK